MPSFTNLFSVHITFQLGHEYRVASVGPDLRVTFLVRLARAIRLHDRILTQALDQETKQLKTATTEHANEHAGNQTRPNANRNASLSEVS